MRLNLAGGVVAALLVVALIVAYGTLFTVYQTRQALVVRLGEPVRPVTDPGLHYKVPLIDSVIPLDNRILSTLAAGLPVLVLFWILVPMHRPAPLAGFAGALTAVLVAWLAYGMALPVAENCAVWAVAYEEGTFRPID